MSQQNRISRALKPVNDLIVLNAETTGTILLRQNAFVTDLISASVDQVKVLTSAGSFRDAVESQRAYLKELGSKFQSVTKENVETLRDAGRDAGTVVKGAFSSARDEAGDAVDDFRSEAAGTIERTADSVADSVAPQPEPTPAPTSV
jgi:phasin family protein